MIPFEVIGLLAVVCGVASIMFGIQLLCKRDMETFLIFIIPFFVFLCCLTIACFWSGEIKEAKIKYYPIQEIGTAESPVQVSALESGPLDIVKRFNIVLYNPELYYLEEQSYIHICKRVCIVKKTRDSKYRIVPRSFVEEQ